MNVIGSMIGFFDLVACSSSQLGGWFLVPLLKVLFNLSSQYGAYPGGPSRINDLNNPGLKKIPKLFFNHMVCEPYIRLRNYPNYV